MDPNSTNTLDPKLQETYNKVMGTPSPAPTEQTQQPVNVTPPIAVDTTSAQNPTPVVPTTPYTQDNLSFQAAIQAPSSPATTQSLPGVVQPQTSSSSTLKILYITGAIVFFVVYTFVWIKIFNLPLPF